MDNIKYLTLKHIYLIHDSSIKTFGGVDGIFIDTQGKVESILAQQFPIFEFDKYPSLFQKASMLLYFFKY